LATAPCRIEKLVKLSSVKTDDKIDGKTNSLSVIFAIGKER